jgi:hypothetical protein
VSIDAGPALMHAYVISAATSPTRQSHHYLTADNLLILVRRQQLHQILVEFFAKSFLDVIFLLHRRPYGGGA